MNKNQIDLSPVTEFISWKYRKTSLRWNCYSILVNVIFLRNICTVGSSSIITNPVTFEMVMNKWIVVEKKKNISFCIFIICAHFFDGNIFPTSMVQFISYPFIWWLFQTSLTRMINNFLKGLSCSHVFEHLIKLLSILTFYHNLLSGVLDMVNGAAE